MASLHGPHGAVALRRRHVVRVARQAVADQFGVDLRAARRRAIAPLEDEHGRALAGHHALAVPVERLAALGAMAPRRAKPVYVIRENAVRPAGEHHVGVAGPQMWSDALAIA